MKPKLSILTVGYLVPSHPLYISALENLCQNTTRKWPFGQQFGDVGRT